MTSSSTSHLPFVHPWLSHKRCTSFPFGWHKADMHPFAPPPCAPSFGMRGKKDLLTSCIAVCSGWSTNLDNRQLRTPVSSTLRHAQRTALLSKKEKDMQTLPLSSTCSFSIVCLVVVPFSAAVGALSPSLIRENVSRSSCERTPMKAAVQKQVDDASFALVLLLSSSFCFLNLHPRLTSGFPVSLRRRSLVVDAMVVCLKDFPPRVELEYHLSQEVPIFDLPNSTHISCTAPRFFVLSLEVPFFQEAQGVPSFPRFFDSEVDVALRPSHFIDKWLMESQDLGRKKGCCSSPCHHCSLKGCTFCHETATSLPQLLDRRNTSTRCSLTLLEPIPVVSRCFSSVFRVMWTSLKPKNDISLCITLEARLCHSSQI